MPIAQVTRDLDHHEQDEMPSLESHFVKATLWGVIKKRHPYDFRETYQILRDIFGYEAYYVNLGYWPEGKQTVEPGRLLAKEVASLLDLNPGDKLIEVGSGLGQAAIDLCINHDLARIVGININSRQVAFASALAKFKKIDNRVKHIQGDACEVIRQLAGREYKHLIAIECINHFSDPSQFLLDACEALSPGGKIALSLNVAGSRLGLLQRALLKVTFGFSPIAVNQWVQRLERAGFIDIQAEDITNKVLYPGLSYALSGLAGGNRDRNMPLLVKLFLRLQLRSALRSGNKGKLRYYTLVATAPTAG